MTAVPKLYTPEEVAEALQLHKRTVYGLLRDGRLRAMKTGPEGSWRVTEDALREYMGLDSDSPIPRLPVTPLTPLLMRVNSVWDSLSLGRVLEFSWRTEAGAGQLQLNERALLPEFFATIEADGYIQATGRTRRDRLAEMSFRKADNGEFVAGMERFLSKSGVGVASCFLTVSVLTPETLVRRLEEWRKVHPPKRRPRPAGGATS